jgi:thiamine-phosphate pyrophosphorylase
MSLHHATYQERLTFFIERVTLYPVSCELLANGRSDIEWLDGVLAGGAKIVQLRDKHSDDRIIYEKALVFRKKTSEAGALFMVNNRLDIALLAKADGVHLGNKDLPAEKAREIGPELIIGVSCNRPEQVATAKERGASYYNIGPLYETKTKKNLTPFLGTEAIGKHVKDIVVSGARRIAVVTALTQAENIAEETRCWIEEIEKASFI